VCRRKPGSACTVQYVQMGGPEKRQLCAGVGMCVPVRGCLRIVRCVVYVNVNLVSDRALQAAYHLFPCPVESIPQSLIQEQHKSDS
jgi:hypothetical protein